MPTDDSLVEEYFRLTQKHRADTGPRTAVLLQCGKFFEIYGRAGDEEGIQSPIHQVTRICAIKVANRTSKNYPDLKMVGFPLQSLDKYVEVLLHAGWTIPVYRQSEVPGRTDRSLSHLFTPGTFFSQNTGVSNNLLVIWTELRPASVVRPTEALLMGAACLDNMAGTVTLDEFVCSPVRHDSSDYDWAQELCVAYNPREVRIVAGNDHSEADAMAIEKLAESVLPQACVRRHESAETNVARADKQVYQDEVIQRCYGTTQTLESLTLLNYPQAAAAFTLLLAEAESNDPSLTRRLARPVLAPATPRLVMANHSLRQLNIVHSGQESNKRYTSVLSAIAEGCLSLMGRREVARRVRTPLVDSVAIEARLNEVRLFVDNPELTTVIRRALHCVPDAEALFRSIVHGAAKPDTVASGLRQYLSQIQSSADLLAHNPDVGEAGSLWELLKKARTGAATLHKHTCETFREEPSELALLPELKSESGQPARWLIPQEGGDGEFDLAWAEYSAALAEVEEVKGLLTHVIQQSSMGGRTGSRAKAATTQVLVKLEDVKGGICLTTTQQRVKHAQHWLSRMKATANVPDVLKQELRVSVVAASRSRVENDVIAERIRRLEAARAALSAAADARFAAVMEWYAAHEGMLRDTVEFAATLDVATTAARMAVAHRYCRPELAHDGAVSWFEAEGLRHMLAERLDADELFVPNDLGFGRPDLTTGVRGGGAPPIGLLLFGTNASGKSTLIKSVGIAVTLAQAGFYVPATSFRLRPYAAIYTRILGNDDLFRGLSTFAVEMTEFNAILHNANPRTLVLGDELCSGTETISAVSIFASGLVSLAATGCTHLFATHFHEVVGVPCVQALEGLVCKHLEVRYDAEADTLVYDRKLADGSGDSIYGLEVCKSLKMPQSFIDRAYSVRQVLVPESGSVLGSKTSRYSSKKVRGACELCGAAGAHVHHLVHQADADGERMVDHVRVDAAANLINVCEACHDKFHADGANAVRYRRAKTIDGRTVLVALGGGPQSASAAPS
jgi:DNA mismatch repair protein MutS